MCEFFSEDVCPVSAMCLQINKSKGMHWSGGNSVAWHLP